jgi:hypothetical protein
LYQEEEVKSTISIPTAIVEVSAPEAFLAPLEEVKKD